MISSGTKFLLKTAWGDSLPLLRIQESKVKLGQQEFNYLVLVANIIDDGPESCEQT